MSSNLPQKDLKNAALDKALRPTSWDTYIGQDHIKNNLQILLTAAKQRGDAPDHVLFYGPPGLGKTTLAHLVTHELGAHMRATSGPAIERVGDLASILTNLKEGDVLFIDEIHRLNKLVEEILYPAMESGILDIIIGKGPSARTIQLELPPFTLIGATTRAALLSSPLRSRFSGGVFKLRFYNEEEIEQILERSSSVLGFDATKDALMEIAKRSRRTPRTANYFLKRCRDYAQVHKTPVTVDSVKKTLSMLDVDEKGLSSADKDYLSTIANQYTGGPVGLNSIAATMSEEEDTLAEMHEPYLMQLGFIERTPRGRVLTTEAYAHLGLDKPQ